ncbi:hypothetical protein [Cohnella nanjingensis]|uniref:Uncharacterized protein n=1 Tax=Cohnella nanjingensis TaxID=1387779 RepID=A0A7X0RR00_9BACL|nr:hypothetical protein [Cohnella nanjingensis]MBB6672104.1 hypothetical protein [Cohnella nanjingensis]
MRPIFDEAAARRRTWRAGAVLALGFVLPFAFQDRAEAANREIVPLAPALASLAPVLSSGGSDASADPSDGVLRTPSLTLDTPLLRIALPAAELNVAPRSERPLSVQVTAGQIAAPLVQVTTPAVQAEIPLSPDASPKLTLEATGVRIDAPLLDIEAPGATIRVSLDGLLSPPSSGGGEAPPGGTPSDPIDTPDGPPESPPAPEPTPAPGAPSGSAAPTPPAADPAGSRPSKPPLPTAASDAASSAKRKPAPDEQARTAAPTLAPAATSAEQPNPAAAPAGANRLVPAARTLSPPPSEDKPGVVLQADPAGRPAASAKRPKSRGARALPAAYPLTESAAAGGGASLGQPGGPSASHAGLLTAPGLHLRPPSERERAYDRSQVLAADQWSKPPPGQPPRYPFRFLAVEHETKERISHEYDQAGAAPRMP